MSLPIDFKDARPQNAPFANAEYSMSAPSNHNVTVLSTPKRKPKLLSSERSPAITFSPSIDRCYPSQFANQQDSPSNHSFYLQVLVGLVGSVAVVALIILQPILLKPVLAITAVGVALGLYFFKKPALIEDVADYNNLSFEMEDGAHDQLP